QRGPRRERDREPEPTGPRPKRAREAEANRRGRLPADLDGGELAEEQAPDEERGRDRAGPPRRQHRERGQRGAEAAHEQEQQRRDHRAPPVLCSAGRTSCSRKSITAFENTSFWSPATMCAALVTSASFACGTLARKSLAPSSVTTSDIFPRTSSVGTCTLRSAASNSPWNSGPGPSVRPRSMKRGSQCQCQRPSAPRRSTLRSPAGFAARWRCGV